MTSKPLTNGDVSNGRAKPRQADMREAPIGRKFAPSVGDAAPALTPHDEQELGAWRAQLLIVATTATIFSVGLYVVIRGLHFRRAEPTRL